MAADSQQQRINNCIYRIHHDLSAPVTAQQLAAEAAYSPHHFHRLFKYYTGENIAGYIRRARLELSASRLMFEPGKTVVDIAEECGFQSPASFAQAFAKYFGCSPTAWRKSGYIKHMAQVQAQQQSDWIDKAAAFALPEVTIKTLPGYQIAYVRHLGYDRSIRQAWQYLRAWAEACEIDWQQQKMIGLHHSNPDIIPLAECRYVAGITIQNPSLCRGSVAALTIPGGTYAVMQVSGQLGDVLPLLHNFYHQWLPKSDYHLGSTPGYAIYAKNQFLDEKEAFELDFCVPVSVI